MKSLKPKTVMYRRKREKRTDYGNRKKLLMSGKSRLVLRFTNKRVLAQLVDFTTKGDIVKVGVDSSALSKLGWKGAGSNTSAAYLTGLLLGKKALGKGCRQAILDTGLKRPYHKGKAYGFLKGVLDSGLEIPHGEEVFPPEDRISGKHLKTDLSANFDEVKKKILK